MNNVFVLYDRATNSIWYPTSNDHLEGTSGKLKGQQIQFLARPEPVALKKWREEFPETSVLLRDDR